MISLRNKKVAILGLLDPGVAMIRFAIHEKAQISAFGVATDLDIANIRKEISEYPVKFTTEKIPPDALEGFDLIILTATGEKAFPKQIENAEQKGVPVFTDLEVACDRYKKPMIAVTGSNGKSTVVNLIRQAIENDGKTAMVGGGEFKKFGDTLLEPIKQDFILMEINSVRLQMTRKFRPHVALFLNLHPGHVERHKNWQEYGEAKSKIFAQQTERDYLIFQVSPDVLKFVDVRAVKPKKYPFCYGQPVTRGACYNPQEPQKIIFISDSGKKTYFDLSNVKHPLGPLLVENFMAAVCAAKVIGISDPAIQKMIDQYRPLENRMELVSLINEVRFFNDAKSVNVVAAARALQSFSDHSVLLIAGGQYKTNQHYQTLVEVLKKKAKFLVIFGKDRERFFKKWEKGTETYLVPTLQEAFYLAARRAEPGDVILFSPAAPPEMLVHKTIPSRGRDFKRLIKEHAQVLKHRQYLETKI